MDSSESVSSKKLPYRIYMMEEDMTEIKVRAVRGHMPVGDYIAHVILGKSVKEDEK